MRWFTLLVVMVFSAVSFSVSFDDVIKASSSLETVSCTIRAENHSRSRVSVVEFQFSFKRKNMMRIEYTYPKNMKGTIVAIDGEYFYNYIPSLNRKMKKKLSSNSKNPGKDMGILFHYIRGDLDAVMKTARVEYEGVDSVKVSGEELKTYLFTVTFKDHVEKVWIDEATLFPVKLQIYKKGKLYVELIVSQLKINPKLDPSIFKPF